VAGRNYGTVQNCSVTGSVTSTGNDTGGIVGYNFTPGIVQNCHFTGSVTSSAQSTGGVSGNNTGTVVNSYATGSVTSSGYSGGVVGHNNTANTSGVINCVALNPSVTGTLLAGRVIGHLHNGTDENNYAKAMTVTVAGNPVSVSPSATGKDGKDITAANAKQQPTWETAGFSFYPTGRWVLKSGYLPSLVDDNGNDIGEATTWPTWLVDE